MVARNIKFGAQSKQYEKTWTRKNYVFGHLSGSGGSFANATNFRVLQNVL